MIIKSKKAQDKIINNKSRYLYRGIVSGSVIGYTDDTKFMCYDDIELRRTVHIPATI